MSSGNIKDLREAPKAVPQAAVNEEPASALAANDEPPGAEVVNDDK